VDVDKTAIHAGRVEGQRDISVAIDGNQSTRSAQRTHLTDNSPSRRGEIHSAVLYQCRNIVSGHGADKEFAIAGRGNSTGLVVRVGAGADNRRVADSARPFIRISAGGGGGRQVARLIERNGADGPVPIRIRKPFSACGSDTLQGLPALRGVKVFLLDNR